MGGDLRGGSILVTLSLRRKRNPTQVGENARRGPFTPCERPCSATEGITRWMAITATCAVEVKVVRHSRESFQVRSGVPRAPRQQIVKVRARATWTACARERGGSIQQAKRTCNPARKLLLCSVLCGGPGRGAGERRRRDDAEGHGHVIQVTSSLLLTVASYLLS
jgi:hypothetical protein